MNECAHCHASLGPDQTGPLCENCKKLLEQNPLAIFPVRPVEKQSFSLTPWLIASNVLVLGIMLAKGVSPFNPNNFQLLHLGANWGPATLGLGEWWRLITSCWLHGGLLHIAGNMWCLWVLGRNCELFYSTADYFCLYILAGISSSLLSLAIHPLTLSVGASGAVFGMAGVLLVTVNQPALRRWMRPEVRKGVTMSTLKFTGLNLLIGASIPFIDNAGHVGRSARRNRARSGHGTQTRGQSGSTLLSQDGERGFSSDDDRRIFLVESDSTFRSRKMNWSINNPQIGIRNSQFPTTPNN